MASVELRKCFVSLADDLSQVVQVELSRFDAPTVDAGEVRAYSAGRLRNIRRPLRYRTFNIDAYQNDRDVADTLEDWAGRTVLVRTPSGRRLFGRLGDVSTSEEQGVDNSAYASISFTVTEVTVTEVV